MRRTSPQGGRPLRGGRLRRPNERSEPTTTAKPAGSGWEPLGRPPSTLLVTCWACRAMVPNLAANLNGWEQSRWPGRRRRFRCPACRRSAP